MSKMMPEIKDNNISKERFSHADNFSSVVQDLQASTNLMESLLEDPNQPITIANKIVTCSVTILVFLTAAITLRVLSRSPLLPANRYFLFSLSFSDLLQAGITLPLSITIAISENWNSLPPYVWLFQISLSVHLWLTGLYSLAFVNVDHYIAVTEASHYLHQLGPRKSACWVIFIWILGLSYGLPLFLIGPEWAVLCSSNLVFCIINHYRIAAYSVTAILILLPPPLVIFVVTGYRGLFPHPDDTYKSSVERTILYRANTAAGIATLLLWFLGILGALITHINPTIRLVIFWMGISAPLWRAVCYWGVAAPIIKYSYDYSEIRKPGY